MLLVHVELKGEWLAEGNGVGATLRRNLLLAGTVNHRESESYE